MHLEDTVVLCFLFRHVEVRRS